MRSPRAIQSCVKLLILSALIVSIAACDSNRLSIKDGQFQGHGMSFDIPEGYTDINDHHEFEESGLVRQVRRAKGVAAGGELGQQLYSMILLLPAGPANAVEMNEELCREIGQKTSRQARNRNQQLGLSPGADIVELSAPGKIEGTTCEFLLSLGRGEFYSLNIFFIHGDTQFLASCEADTKQKAFEACDDMFSTWRR